MSSDKSRPKTLNEHTDPPRGVDSYFICGTPRTGSSLLCGLLDSTDVAGHPESYFRKPDEESWATRWDIARSSNGTFRYIDFLQAAIAAGRTDNGVFAARIMWGTLDELVEHLGAIYPDLTGSDLDLLNRAFGSARFVYLRRDNVVEQAVSWFRAEQTDVWVETHDSRPSAPLQGPHYDFDGIRKLVQTIDEHNSAWQEWFASVGVEPHPVHYEALDADPVGVTQGVLEHLGLTLPAGNKIVTKHRRLADDLNAEWISRYTAERAQQ